MGTDFGDVDNDGWLDFHVGTGNPDRRSVIPNRMFRSDLGRRFVEVTIEGRFGHLQKGHGAAFGDLDRDGDEDIYMVMGGAYQGDRFTSLLFENPGWAGRNLDYTGTGGPFGESISHRRTHRGRRGRLERCEADRAANRRHGRLIRRRESATACRTRPRRACRTTDGCPAGFGPIEEHVREPRRSAGTSYCSGARPGEARPSTCSVPARRCRPTSPSLR